MPIPHAPILTQVLNEAADIARATEQGLTTGHVLLALFTVGNNAERILEERKIDEDRLLDLVQGRLTEPPDSVASLVEHASQFAAGCGARELDCLHLLYSMTRNKDCAAHDLLARTGESLHAIRQRALGVAMGSMPIWVQDEAEASSHVARAPRRRSLRSSLPRPGMSKAVEWVPPRIPPGRSLLRPPEPASRVSEAPRVGRTVEPAPVPSKKPAAPVEDDAAHWRLSATEYPWLTSVGRNLSVAAALEEIEEVAGRETELEAVLDILGKRRANNPCLLGEPGVGKTAVVESLALRLVNDPPTKALGEKILIELDVGALLIGTHLRGSFSEKLSGLKEEVKRSGRVIVFFDELHTLVGAGSTGDGAQDAANELKAALARGEFPCIGATTTDEWKKHIEPDRALKRRFYPVMVKEPSPEVAAKMVAHSIDAYAAHHRVRYSAEVVEAACKLSARFIVDRQLPDKAVTLLDLAGSRVARAGRNKVTVDDVARLVAEQAEIPVERVLSSDRAHLLDLERHLAAEIVGHRPALARVAEVIRRSAAGFGGRRPQGSFLFLGPTGVGKTETAKAIARALHGTEDALLRFDLSEFAEAHAVARLVGAPPGYVGHDAGGQLTEEIRRRPARVILLDEIEKAHRDVLQVFLQVLDDGRLTDSHGRTVGFGETIIIMTSNLGSDAARPGRAIGFGAREAFDLGGAILEAAQAALAPELWGRIEERLVFAPLEPEEIREVTRRLARASSARLAKERGIAYVLDDGAVDFLVQQGGFDARLGARPMRHILSRIVEGPIAARILEGRLHADEQVFVSTTERGTLSFLVGDERTSLSQRPSR